MQELLKKIHLVFLLVFAGTNIVFCNTDNDEKETLKKDTVTALVIDPTNPFYKDLTKLSGDEIIDLIDSLLDQKQISNTLLKEINDYVENQVFEHDYYVSLTNYYEGVPIPSSSMYGKWDTQNISPYDDSISDNDTSLFLKLTDVENLCTFEMPTKNTVVTSHYGYRDGRNHNGIDLDLEVWDPVYASFEGMVRIALKHPGYGRVVVIRHYNGLETLYAHLHRIKVKPGDIVEAGQIIGLGGSSGNSTGSHLHYEVRFKGKAINPKHIISFNENKLISNVVELKKKKHSYLAVPDGVCYHTIERGDYMQKIASRYGLSVAELCNLNDISRKSVLRVGKQIRIK
ncbi:MAG: peptidoglycan DD-metalloendopeptidase family protein [Flavobacteriales bacterium]|nr:peptidoglycan DD-metalloendopeptidase family protein [Flavobacteriales bacterium]